MANEKQGRSSLLDRLVILSPLLVVPPILAYGVGYVFAYGYLSGFGLDWVIHDLPTVKYLEFSIYPLTTFAVAVGVAVTVVGKSPSPKILLTARVALYVLTYLFLCLWLVSLMVNIETSIVKCHWAAELTLGLWCIVPTLCAIKYLARVNIQVDRVTVFFSYIVSIFGFLLIVPLYGNAIAYLKSKDSVDQWDMIITKATETKKPELLQVVLAKDDTFYAIQPERMKPEHFVDEKLVPKIEPYLKDWKVELPGIYSVRILKAEEILAIYPRGAQSWYLVFREKNKEVNTRQILEMERLMEESRRDIQKHLDEFKKKSGVQKSSDPAK